MVDWLSNLGLKKNPFAENHTRPSAFLVGLSQQQDQIRHWIKNERFGTIIGDLNTGKTFLLHWIVEELRGQKEHVLLISGKETRDEMCKKMLSSHLTLLEKGLGTLFRKSSAEKEKDLKDRLAAKRVFLIVDDAGSLGKREVNFLSDLIFRTRISMLFADTAQRLKALALPETFVDKLKVQTPSYTSNELKELLTLRLKEAGAETLFDDAVMQDLVKTTNPGQLLSHAQEKAMELGKEAKPVVKKTGFFTIKIEKQQTAQHETAEPYKAAEPHKVAAHERHEDAAMLAKIIELEPVKVKPKFEERHLSLDEVENTVTGIPGSAPQIITQDHIPTEAAPKTKHDKVIAQLMGQIEQKPKKKPKKR